MLASGYVQVDETPVDYLDPGGGKTGTGWLWTASRPSGDVIFQWETSRASAYLGKLLPANFTGIQQGGGYPPPSSFPVASRSPLSSMQARELLWSFRATSASGNGHQNGHQTVGKRGKMVGPISVD